MKPKEILKKIAGKASSKFIKTKLGRRLFRLVAFNNPDEWLYIGVYTQKGIFKNITLPDFLEDEKDIRPAKLENFEDLFWLFSSNPYNRKIIRMRLNEAAYMFKVVKENRPNTLLEIGRCVGGSTILLATAKKPEAQLLSIDIKPHQEERLKELLDQNTILLIGDSREYKPPFKLDFLFIDGDHGYEEVKADFYHYLPYLNQGADILFHDAVDEKQYRAHQRVNRFIKEIENCSYLKIIKDVGTLRHFKLLSERPL